MAKYFLILIFLCACLSSAAWPYYAVCSKASIAGMASSKKSDDKVFFISESSTFDDIKEPHSQGVFILTESRENFTEKPYMVWVSYSSDRPILTTDIAIAVKETLTLPKSAKANFVRKISTSDGTYSTISWQYRVLGDDYARLTKYVNSSPGINIYDGEPLKTVDVTSVFLIKPLIKDLSKPLQFKFDFIDDGIVSKSLDFDLKTADIIPDSAFVSQVVLDSAKRSNIDSKAYNIGQYFPDFSKAYFRRIIYKDETVFDVQTGAWDNPLKVNLNWDGMLYDGEVPAEPGTYNVRLELCAFNRFGPVSFSPLEKEVKVLPYRRLLVFNEANELISDSRFKGAALPEALFSNKLSKPFVYAPLPASYGYSLDRIYMRRCNEDGNFKLKLISPSNSETLVGTVSSNIRQPIFIVLKNMGDGTFEGKLPVSAKKSTDTTLVLGNSIKKGFAFLDTTYTEDSEAFSAFLKNKGWESRGSIYPEDLDIPDKALFLADFVRSGGYEKFVFSVANPEVSLTSYLLMKNQAQIFYYSGHGWGDGAIHTSVESFHPLTHMKPGDWNDGLSMVIFSSCSVLDINNVHNHKFTHIGNFMFSPGIHWANVAGDNVALLGYNWSTFEGKPPNAFDTRVIKSFLQRIFNGDQPVSAWMNANISNKEMLAPCCILDHVYYCLNGSAAISTIPQSKWRSQIPR